MSAMPIMLAILCLMAIAYRYYSAFLAAKVACLDDSRETPAYRLNDGHNFHPTSKWVLFGHHFAAISGAGPLIGPVLAAQFGYMPGLLWIVIGVCLAGAVQDFLALAASIRHNGRSIAQIAYQSMGKVPGTAAMAAIIFILIIALAGLGKVVVKALGGEEVKYPAGSVLDLPSERNLIEDQRDGYWYYTVPRHTSLVWPDGSMEFSDKFVIRTATPLPKLQPFGPPYRYVKTPTTQISQAGFVLLSDNSVTRTATLMPKLQPLGPLYRIVTTPTSQISQAEFLLLKTQQMASEVYTAPTTQPAIDHPPRYGLPPDAVRLVPGSSWGTFTIACTIPIALFVGLYMYKIRKGRVVEASLIGAALTLGATFAGGWVPQQSFGQIFNLKDTTVIWCMAAYGFIASILPVWVLLCPRDYLSSFLKIGTIAVLVGGVLIANPKFQAPAFNTVFMGGGPTVTGQIFPFLFITIMCGAISGFHSLVSSGTTPKMIKRESDARTIGYGAMLIEGLVGVTAMIAAAALPVQDYYAMNTDLAKVPVFQDKILQVGGGGGIEHLNVPQDNLPRYESLTQESLRGRTGGAVTLAVGMAEIFDKALSRFAAGGEKTLQAMWKYWYHFAIMFEALFILTTIDTGTRVGRFVLQELMGRIHPKLGQNDWWPSAILSTFIIVAGWTYFIFANSMAAIWPMFGVSNQLLAVIALAVISVWLVNEGRSRYLWVTVIPLLVVLTTTSTAAVQMFVGQWRGFANQISLAPAERNLTLLFNSAIQGSLIVAMLVCTFIVLAFAAMRIAMPRPEAPAASEPTPQPSVSD